MNMDDIETKLTVIQETKKVLKEATKAVMGNQGAHINWTFNQAPSEA